MEGLSIAESARIPEALQSNGIKCIMAFKSCKMGGKSMECELCLKK